MTWFTDLTLGGSCAQSAFSKAAWASFTLAVLSVPEGSWRTHGAFACFFTEKTSSWTLGTVTVSIVEVLSITDFALVNLSNTLLVVDLGNLTVGQIKC